MPQGTVDNASMSGETNSAPDRVAYRHHMFGWERRAASNGERRLETRGNSTRFLDQGREAYGYLLCGAIWGTMAAALAILVFFPTLIIGRGMTVASGVELGVIYALLLMAVIRLWQSKRSRIGPG